MAHFEDKEDGLPQIKMISCAPALEDFTQIKVFEERLANLKWPKNTSNIEKWRELWSSAFTTGYHQVIQDSSTLTIQLAAEAQEIRNRILDALSVETKNGYVHLLFEKFKDTLIHDMKEIEFADMYAQTLVYGLFSARCMDDTEDSFSATEAIECIPNTNPFLKNLMRECLGTQNNSILSFDELDIGNVVDLLKNTNTKSIIQDFNRQTGGGKEDPVIHFYEEFLTAYDKAQKIQRGVYYTPQPVVSFIVRAVDYILKTEFGFKDGLATTETKTIKVKRQSKTKRDGLYHMVDDTEEVPAVQVLDPATGTGTFIRQTIIQIYENFKERNKHLNFEQLHRAWNEYVPKHLLPRLNAFELMMAPYAVAHMKLAMVLKDTGYDFKTNKRLQVYLTNTLEEPGNSDGQMTLFEDPLAAESIEANRVKKNSGINIIIGNPPYSGESANKGPWIMNLMEDYKKEPGGITRLNERNPKWLNDDYVKFIRYSEYTIQPNNKGIIAFINPHGFIDNPTFRGMRWHMLKSFNTIYIIDLHGNVNKHEKCPDGSKDENVFDIQQGVSLMFAIKDGSCKECKVYHSDLYGLRTSKYEYLTNTRFDRVTFEKVNIVAPQYFFCNSFDIGADQYNQFVSLKDLFVKSSLGVVTGKDKIFISDNYEKLKESIRKSFLFEPDDNKIFPINYRPFDTRYIYYDQSLLARSRPDVIPSLKEGDNYGLVYRRQSPDPMGPSYFFVCNNIMADGYIRSDNKGGESVSPLYINENGLTGKMYNFDHRVITRIEKDLNMTFTSDSNDQVDSFTGLDLISYIYAVVYSPQYRKQYGAFVKKDYPRIPFEIDRDKFWALSRLGKQLIDVHLLISKIDNKVQFHGKYDFILDKPNYVNNKIILSKYGYYFDSITPDIWDYYLGGYQPLQKWAKDHKGCIMTKEMIDHYQNIINAVIETKCIVAEIDEIY